MVHELKILPEYFMPVILGEKAFEVRKDDRPFSVGDMLLLREYRNGEYTGNAIKAEITYILRGEYCKKGYCILGIERRGYWRSWENHAPYFCSQCGKHAARFAYCPHCGSRMGGSKEKSLREEIAEQILSSVEIIVDAVADQGAGADNG